MVEDEMGLHGWRRIRRREVLMSNFNYDNLHVRLSKILINLSMCTF